MKSSVNVVVRPPKVIGTLAVAVIPVVATIIGLPALSSMFGLQANRDMAIAIYLASLVGFLGGAGLSAAAFNRWIERKRVASEIQEGLDANNLPGHDADVLAEPENVSQDQVGVGGETYARLIRAIQSFPAKYPDYLTDPPKLNDDVRLWLHEVGLVTDGQKGREAHVFGKVIAEHFKLPSVTSKT